MGKVLPQCKLRHSKEEKKFFDATGWVLHKILQTLALTIIWYRRVSSSVNWRKYLVWSVVRYFPKFKVDSTFMCFSFGAHF